MNFVPVVWLVVRKDLLVELRSREILYTTVFFAVSCVLVFAFGFVREGQPMGDVGAGILWIAVAFSGTLALGRAFERERQSETLRALLMAPVDRPALYANLSCERAVPPGQVRQFTRGVVSTSPVGTGWPHHVS